MKFSLTASLILLSAATVMAQSGKIEIRRNLGASYYLGSHNLKPGELLEATSSNTEAYFIMKQAKTNYTVSQVLGIAGGALVGFPLGTAIGGGEPEWAMAGIGAGLILLSIPFTVAYNKKAQEAIGIYNSGLAGGASGKVNAHIGFSQNGIGVRIMF